MAVQVQYPGGDVQWIPGGNYRLPVNQQVVPAGTEIISMTDDHRVINWDRRPAPFADLYDSHVNRFRSYQYEYMRREYRQAGESF